MQIMSSYDRAGLLFVRYIGRRVNVPTHFTCTKAKQTSNSCSLTYWRAYKRDNCIEYEIKRPYISTLQFSGLHSCERIHNTMKRMKNGGNLNSPRDPFCIAKHEILQRYQITARSTFILNMYNYSISLHVVYSLSRCIILLRTPAGCRQQETMTTTKPLLVYWVSSNATMDKFDTFSNWITKTLYRHIFYKAVN